MIAIDKKYLIRQCSQQLGYTQKMISEVYDYIWSTYKQEILSGDSLSISGFGSIEIVNRKSKNHKHPITGDYIQGRNYKTLRLSPTQSFMKQLNNSDQSA